MLVKAHFPLILATTNREVAYLIEKPRRHQVPDQLLVSLEALLLGLHGEVELGGYEANNLPDALATVELTRPTGQDIHDSAVVCDDDGRTPEGQDEDLRQRGTVGPGLGPNPLSHVLGAAHIWYVSHQALGGVEVVWNSWDGLGQGEEIDLVQQPGGDEADNGEQDHGRGQEGAPGPGGVHGHRRRE